MGWRTAVLRIRSGIKPRNCERLPLSPTRQRRAEAVAPKPLAQERVLPWYSQRARRGAPRMTVTPGIRCAPINRAGVRRTGLFSALPITLRAAPSRFLTMPRV